MPPPDPRDGTPPPGCSEKRARLYERWDPQVDGREPEPVVSRSPLAEIAEGVN